MITGTSQADAALLVISAAQGEFEVGVSRAGQTRQHMLLAHALGIKQLIICINKMDEKTVDFDEQRFVEVKREVEDLAKKTGFNPRELQFVPVSGFFGDNIVDKSPKLPWWKGRTLIEALFGLAEPVRPIGKALRVPIHDVYKIQGVGTITVGRVEGGILQTGLGVMFSPGKFTSEVKSIQMHHENLDSAEPGDNVGFLVENLPANICRGWIILGKSSLITVLSWIAALVTLLANGRN